MQDLVNDLSVIIHGQKARLGETKPIGVARSSKENRQLSPKSKEVPPKIIQQRKKEVRPQDVIPMDDDAFENF